MRHRVHGRKLGRTTAHRKALFRNQLTALFTHERIVTTLAKARELRPLAEKMVTLAGTGSLPNRRRIMTLVPDKEIVRRLFDEIAPRFVDRPGGYTRILKMGRRRGDGAEMAIIEFVDFSPSTKSSDGSTGASKQSLMDRAKGLFGGGRRPAESDGAEVETAATETEAAAETGSKVVEDTAAPDASDAVDEAGAPAEAEADDAVAETVEDDAKKD